MKMPTPPGLKQTHTRRVNRTPSRTRASFELLEKRELLALSFLSQPMDTVSGEVIKPFQVKSDTGASALTMSLT
jgi:hypothetical protein